MDYLEIKIDDKSGEHRDIILARLSEEGFESFIEEQESLVAYIPAASFNKKKIELLLSGYGVSWQYSVIPEMNWNEEWEKHYDPVLISDKCFIRAPFHPPLKGIQFDIIIEPKMSFGTAHHETTALMIKLMMESKFTGRKVLDMGCGTGVLAILAYKLGASDVVAADIDDWSYQNCLENIERNKAGNIRVVLGNVKTIKDKGFDIILANINRNVLLGDMPDYSRLISGGELFLSGFYKEDIPVIIEKAEQTGFKFLTMMTKNNWVGMKFLK
jgi:ribosomal protein L11 methyltransferase